MTCPTCEGSGRHVQYIRKGRHDPEHKEGPIEKVTTCPLCKGKKTIKVRY